MKRYIIILGLLIALLNLSDGLITIYGLTNHFIEEANPIMRYLAEINPALFLGAKVILSFFIALVSFLVHKHSKIQFQRIFSLSLTGVSFIYITIMFMHLYWISQIGFTF